VVRMYLMFMGPFDSTMAWNENTLMGVKRFLDRFEQYIRSQISDVRSQKERETASSEEVKVIINKLVEGVTNDLNNFKYNTAIAKMMEALNKMSDVRCQMSDEEIKTLIKLIAPLAPYMAEELWNKLGNKGSVHVSNWPVADKKYLIDKKVTVAVAINGKTREQISVDRSQMSDEKKMIKEAKELEKIKQWIGDKKIIKEVYVPGKMINFVIIENT